MRQAVEEGEPLKYSELNYELHRTIRVVSRGRPWPPGC